MNPANDIHIIRAKLAAHRPETEASLRVKRPASVALALRPGEKGLEALFIRRAEHDDDPWSGHMALPGGSKEENDASVEATARREAWEEVGLELSSDQLIGRLSDITGGRLEWFDMALSAFVYYVEEHPILTICDTEVAETVWIPLQFLMDPKNVSEFLWEMDPDKRLFPAFQFGPYTIWGLTYRIIAEFNSLFGIEIPVFEKVTRVE